jgi:ketosteroid isomerase-like protein
MKKSSYLVSLLLLLGISSEALHLHARAQSTGNKAAIEALYKEFNDAFNKKDANAIMAVYAQRVFVFDALPPRQYPSWDAYKKDWEGLFAAFPGPLTNAISEMDITVVDSVAYTLHRRWHIHRGGWLENAFGCSHDRRTSQDQRQMAHSPGARVVPGGPCYGQG